MLASASLSLDNLPRQGSWLHVVVAVPPPPERRSKSKPIWKQWWFWAIVVVVHPDRSRRRAARRRRKRRPKQARHRQSRVRRTPLPPRRRRRRACQTSSAKSVDDATSELEAAGFVVSVETRLTNSAPKGTVLRQSEPAGSSVELGETITLTVAQAAPEDPQRRRQDAREREARAPERRLRGRQGDAADVEQEEGDRDLAVARQRDIGASRAGGLARHGQARAAAVEQLHAGLLALPATGIGLRLLGGTGDGPEYTGFVRVTGSDPYGLDADGDGTGCE